MMKTVNDLIKELQNLKPSYKKLPVVIKAENGRLLNPEPKAILDEKGLLEEPSQIIITYD